MFTRLGVLHRNREPAIARPGGSAQLQRRYAVTIRPGLRIVEP